MYNNSNQQQYPHTERYQTGNKYFIQTEVAYHNNLINQQQQQQYSEKQFFQNLIRVSKITKFKVTQEININFQPQKHFVTKFIQNKIYTIKEEFNSLFNKNQQPKQQNNTQMIKKNPTFQAMYHDQVKQNKKILEKIAQKDRQIQNWKAQYINAKDNKPHSNNSNNAYTKDLERKIANLEINLKRYENQNAKLQKQNKNLETYHKYYLDLSEGYKKLEQNYKKCHKQREDLKQYINGAQIQEKKKVEKQKQKTQKYKQKKVKVEQNLKKRMQQSSDKSLAAFYERMQKVIYQKKQVKMSKKREEKKQMKIRGSNPKSLQQKHLKMIQEQSEEQTDQIQQYQALIESILQETSKTQKQYLIELSNYQAYQKLDLAKIQQLNRELAGYDVCKNNLSALSTQNIQLNKKLAIFKKQNEILVNKLKQNEQQYQFKVKRQFQIITDLKNVNSVYQTKTKKLQQQLSQQGSDIKQILQQNSKLHEQFMLKQNQVELLKQKIIQLNLKIQKSTKDNTTQLYQKQLQDFKQKIQEKNMDYNKLLKNSLILEGLKLSSNNAAIHDLISKKNKNLYISMDENNQVKSIKQKIQNQHNQSLIIMIPQFFLNILKNEKQLTIKEHVQQTFNAQYHSNLKKHQQKNNNDSNMQSIIFVSSDDQNNDYKSQKKQIQTNQQTKKQEEQDKFQHLSESQPKQVKQQKITSKDDKQSLPLQQIQKFQKFILLPQAQIQEQNKKIKQLQQIKVSYQATMKDYVYRMNVLNDQVGKGNHKFQNLTEAFKDLQTQMKNLQNHMKQNMIERNLCLLKQQHKTLIHQKNNQIENKNKQIASLKTKVQQKTQQIKQLTQIKNLQQRSNPQIDNNQKIQDSNTIISNLYTQISSQTVKSNQIQTQNKQLTQKINNFNSKINQICKQINQNTNIWQYLQNNQKLQNIKTYIIDNKQTLKKKKQQIQELNNTYIKQQKIIRDLQLQIQRKQSEIKRRQQEIRNQYANSQILQSNQLAHQKQQLSQQILKLKDNINKSQEKIKTLQSQKSSLNAEIDSQSLQISQRDAQILSLQSNQRQFQSAKITQIQQLIDKHQIQINNRLSDYKKQIQKSNKEQIQNKVNQLVKLIQDQQTRRIRGQFENEYKLKKSTDESKLNEIRKQLDDCKQKIIKLQNQKLQLVNINKIQKKEEERFQQPTNIRSNTNRSIYMPANFRFNSDILYQAQLQKSEILLNQIQYAIRKKVKRSSLLFRFTEKKNSNLNPHVLIDGKPNILLLIKLKNGQVLGGFSEKEFFKGTISVANWEWWGTLFNLNKKKFFYLKRQEGKRVLNWDQYYITFGNNDIKIKYGQNYVESNFAVSSGDFDSRGQKVDSLLGCGNIQNAQLQCYQIHQVFYYQPDQLRSHQAYLANSTTLMSKIDQLTKKLNLSSQQTQKLKIISQRRQKQLSFLQKQKASLIQTKINSTKGSMNQSLSNVINSVSINNMMSNGFSQYFYGEIMKNQSEGRGFLIENIIKLLEYGKVIDTQLVFRKGINPAGLIKKVKQVFNNNQVGMSACLFILKTKNNQRLGIYCTSFNSRTKQCYLFNISSKKVFYPSQQCITTNEDGFKFDPSITRLVFGTHQLEIKGSAPNILQVNINGGMGARYFEIQRGEFIDERYDQIQMEEVEVHNVLISMTKQEQEIMASKLPEESKIKRVPTLARGFRELE